MTKATVSDSVKILEQKKLVVRNYLTADNRSFRLALTDQGREIAKSTSVFASVLQAQVQSLSSTHQSSLLDSLLEIIYRLDQSSVITAQRMCKTCRFFELGKKEHYCSLMKQPLRKINLRLDCPEHESKLVAGAR